MTAATQQSTAIELEGKDLPAYCPNPAMPVWSTHPRVFLDLSHGEAKCPYCGTAYRLKPGTVVHGH
ncbi:zinc-finger domain-containing protein [Oxalicibacterium solurbis]|uniref:Zinc-finger domain-containing protein n=1 Tax=Oxalicibacterium solurbis TaxID=69280 RepID=A0A8J3F442_9BURK|nr:zinc-finger domain-containing protein [Oxalicibacterium solurbis]GGI54152.1 zinc-finger domain-containing protein [Oxalicibacterium solurbis]